MFDLKWFWMIPAEASSKASLAWCASPQAMLIQVSESPSQMGFVSSLIFKPLKDIFLNRNIPFYKYSLACWSMKEKNNISNNKLTILISDTKFVK